MRALRWRQAVLLAAWLMLAPMAWLGSPPAGSPLPAAIGAAASGDPASAAATSADPASAATSAEPMLTVEVRLRVQVELRRPQANPRPPAELLRALQTTAQQTQAPLLTALQRGLVDGSVAAVTPLWIVNALVVTARPAVIQALAARPEVAAILPETTYELPPLPPARPVSGGDHLATIGAPQLWALGWRGQGVVVATVDSGAAGNHPELRARWRGGANSWRDVTGEYPDFPTDPDGHGTRVLGAMVAGEASGAPLGVAPAAQWIAVRIFNQRGQATSTGIHLAYQWLLDPDGDPTTPDAPDVVNSSWSFQDTSCDLRFQPDLLALRAAGIAPIFAAGNFGPQAATAPSPANYPEALAVGALDEQGVIVDYSSRGPSPCEDGARLFPALSAPGVAIRTTAPGGGYTEASGTSLAAPQVAGGLALLLSAYPDLPLAWQEGALLFSAHDLGAPGPDASYGMGRLDLPAALAWLTARYRPPTPTPLPTATPTPEPLPWRFFLPFNRQDRWPPALNPAP